jgi:hypothetical protein
MATINATAGMSTTLYLDGAPAGIEDWQVRVYDNTGAVVLGPALDDLDTLTEGVAQTTVAPGEVQYNVTLTAPDPAVGYEPDDDGNYPYTVDWMSDGQASDPDVLLVSLMPDLTTAVGRFRLELGDLDSSVYLFTDEQAQYFIDKHPTNLLLAVADACDALAARFASEFDFQANGERNFKLSQKAEHYLELGNRLRDRAMCEGDGSGTATLAATDGQILRVLKSTACRVTATFDTDDAPTNATGLVAVQIDHDDGTPLRSGVASSTGNTGQYYLVLTAEDTSRLDKLRLTWTATIAEQEQALTTFVEVRGARLFSLTQARRLRPLDNATAYPNARLVEARTWAEIELERVCETAFAPTYFCTQLDGNGRTALTLPVRRPSSVTSVTIDGSAVDVADLVLYSMGRIYRADCWPRGRQNITITGTYGYDHPPPRIGSACCKLAREFLVGDGSIDPLDCPLVAAAVAEYSAPIGYPMA